MVTRLSRAPLRDLTLSSAARKAFASPAPTPLRASDPEEVAIRRSDLDRAIARVSSALSALLDLEVRAGINDDPEPLRRDAMTTDSAGSNVNERYDVFVVENYEDGAGAEKSNWTRIGVAFPHKDSEGFNLELRAVPVSGKLVIRRHVAKARSASDA